MQDIRHHISDPLLLSYAAGTLAQPFALVIAAHVSMCDECRARLGAHEGAGGVLLEHAGAPQVSQSLKGRVFDALDLPAPEFIDVAPREKASGVFPAPVMEALKGAPPKWRSVGMGVRQSILSAGSEGSVRLLYIPPGQAVPDHTHGGLELTLVLQGAFSDETGRFGVGDVEIASDDLDHAPVAEDGAPCICLAATDAPLRFNSLIPRLFQPLFRI